MHEFLKFLTSDTSPWWTTLAGVALGYFFSRANENTKAKREAQERWVSQIQNISADFVNMMTEVMRIKNVQRNAYIALSEKYSGVELNTKQTEFKRSAYIELDPVLLRTNDCVTRLSILNAGPISTAAKEHWDHLLTMKVTDTSKTYKEWFEEYRRLHKEFTATAQRLVPAKNHKQLSKKALPAKGD
jgi:uncharacterized membrane-anchored protein YhcB (DUF1043 family)